MSATATPIPPIDAGLRSALARLVRRRVDAEDVVQAMLLEVISARARPGTPEDVWHFAPFVGRKKVADNHRRRSRSAIAVDPEDVTNAVEPGPVDARDLRDWVDRVLPPGTSARLTSGWMLREGEGESLSEVARSEQVAPELVRQRVSRRRRFLRPQWAREDVRVTLPARDESYLERDRDLLRGCYAGVRGFDSIPIRKDGRLYGFVHSGPAAGLKLDAMSRAFAQLQFKLRSFEAKNPDLCPLGSCSVRLE